MAIIHDHENERRSLPGDKYGFGLMEHGDTILADTKIERDRVRAAFHIWKMSRGSEKRLSTYREGRKYRIEMRDPAREGR